MAKVEILQAHWRDARALKQLEKRCFRPVDNYSLITYFWLLIWPRVVTLKAVVDGEIVGFIASDPRRRAAHVIIVTVGVHPEWRRRGIGEQLMHACEARSDLPRFHLMVRVSNASAIHLYQKLGYEITSRVPRYYADEDGFSMEKTIASRQHSDSVEAAH